LTNLSSPSSKENGSIVISKDECGKLSWDHKLLLVLFLDHGDTVCWLLTAAIFCKSLQLLRQSIVLLHENARCHTPNWTALYGCISDRLWISLNLTL